MSRSALQLAVIAAIVVAAPRVAHAYRPFDGTDADTAELDTIELEIGPLQGSTGSGSSSYEPGFVFNYGFAPGFELVVDADGETIPDSSTLVTDVQVKHVLREGSLQGQSGPSIALETGPLLPNVPVRGPDGTHGAGWDASLIVSYHWTPLTVHANFYGAYDRDRDVVGWVSTILEGPVEWRVRPVAELLAGRENGDTSDLASALVGVLWHVSDHIVIDAAGRAIRTQGLTEGELRAGFTWVFDI
jgi:hypothetical protein